MPNRTFVCLECRTSRRAKAVYGKPHELRCVECSKGLKELPWERRIPTKSDDAGWDALRIYLAQLGSKTTAAKKKTIEKKPKGIRSLFQLPSRKRKQVET